ncbi:MAG: ABC transporter substrate-binding protein [Anaerofustis stercorihominis]|nr:ABC transporter substrate-binding protein [Anaerofustis stercorihominis]
MKKLMSLLLVILMAFTCFTACGDKEEAPEAIRLGGLKGPTSMGMVKLLDDNSQGLTENKYEFTMAAAAPELTPAFIKGELDILAVPANLAATLYNNTEGKVQMLAINTLGVIYIAEKGGETINSMADLKGKTIYATGKGQTPEYCLQYLLSENGLTIGTDVTVEWKSEPTEVVATIATMDTAVAMLPQPFVTVAQNSVENLRVALSLTDEWDKLDNGSSMITGALIVRKEFAETYPQTLAKFLEEYEASTKWINENVEEGAALVEKYDIVKAAIAKKAIPYCNITCITGEDMATTADGYLNVLFNANATSVGGSVPGEELYYVGK